ncbi:CXADR-like membrane protein isoform X2 [Hyperolius riggenbachi]|uniref:CXADR-like membrane protein isoform X2 n=1 Tax=Hyperolius riggenbachi TaxID=752182 RepID=UPI0035A2D668
MRLLISLFCFFQGVTTSSGKYCAYQVQSRTVKEGGSVTIPCSYAIPEEQQKGPQIIWKESNDLYCYISREDFTLSEDVTEKYAGRVIIEKDSHRNWTEAIRITGLKTSDGPIICCHVVYNTKEKSVWSSSHGTRLQFPGERYVTQLDELIAVPEEEITIPCHYSRGVTDPAQEVTWHATNEESHDYCTGSKDIHTWRDAHEHNHYSLVNFPQDVSLRIRGIDESDFRYYCCKVSTANRTAIETRHVTKLIITDHSSSLHSHKPPDEIRVQEGGSVTLNCSYTVDNSYAESDIMRVSVYWRVGNVTGPYAYHPHQEMVHPNYTERTTITGTTNLIIRGVQMADNSSFHCIVVLKCCAESNKYEDKIQYGGITRLTVQAVAPTNNSIFLISGAVSAIVILILILVIVACVIYKKRKNFPDQNMKAADATDTGGGVTCEDMELPYCEITPRSREEEAAAVRDEGGRQEMASGQMADEEDTKLLYAKLDKAKLKGRSQTPSPQQREEVVYADIVKPPLQ